MYWTKNDNISKYKNYNHTDHTDNDTLIHRADVNPLCRCLACFAIVRQHRGIKKIQSLG